MKPLVFTLSIYFLFLTLLPCSCDLQVVDSFHEKTEEASTTQNENDLAQFACTPFCACSSYHNPNYVEKNNFDIQNIDIISDKNTVYNENSTSSFLKSLWRPPQV